MAQQWVKGKEEAGLCSGPVSWPGDLACSVVHYGRSSKGWGVRVEREKRGACGERERTDIS